MVSRYAFFSPLTPSSSAVKVRLTVSDPGSYVYLDRNRPTGNCLSLSNTGSAFTCSTFTLFGTGYTPCNSYNVYKYGLTNLGSQSGTYMKSWTAAQLSSAITAFKTKDVRFIFGTTDACNCNTPGFANDAVCFQPTEGCLPTLATNTGCCDTQPDSSSNALDIGCESMMQGSNRLQRGLNYVSYLKTIIGMAKVQYGFYNSGHDYTLPYIIQHPFYHGHHHHPWRPILRLIPILTCP